MKNNQLYRITIYNRYGKFFDCHGLTRITKITEQKITGRKKLALLFGVASHEIGCIEIDKI